MTGISFGDTALTFSLQRSGVTLKKQLQDLSKELATQQVSDVRSVLGGNVAYIADIERDLKTVESYKIASREASQFTSAVQLALEKFQTTAGELADPLLSLSNTPSETLVSVNANEARNRLGGMISSLNSDLGGRTLFSGIATKSGALRDADTLLAALETEITGATTPADAISAAQAWFDDPSGFEATIYTGSTTDLQPMLIAEGEEVSVAVKANQSELKDAIRDVALAALADSAALSMNSLDRKEMLTTIGRTLRSGQDDLVALRAQVGTVEARLEAVNVRNSSRGAALEQAKRDFLSVDPFETATKIEDVRFRLESMYSVTARLAGLSLTGYLR